METYVIKVIAASSLFIAFYFLLLEKEKSLKFNRFYLISTLIFCFTFPLLQVEIQAETVSKEIVPIFSEPASVSVVEPIGEVPINWINVAFVIYAIIVLGLLLKYIFNIVKILNLKGKSIIFRNTKLKIVNQNFTPFSFLNTIYLGEKYFVGNEMNDEIFQHEKTHINSKHSYDLLFVEFLMTIMWFNPALYFYKKALINNHEFIADEEVLRNSKDVKKYQHLILDEINQPKERLVLTNHFYFNNTKQRIIMMTKSKNKKAIWKSFLSIPLIAGVAFFTVQKVYAKTEVLSSEKTGISDVLKPIQEKNVDSKVSDESKITPIQKIDSTKNKKLKNSSKPPVPPTPPTPVSAPQDAPVPPIPMHNEVGTQEDEPAQFPGGLKQIRLLIADTFDNSKIVTSKGSNGVFKAEARYLVDENGKMTNLEVSSDNEEFTKEVRRTLTKIGSENTWIPGKKDGKPVKSYYKIPVSMKFQ